MFFRCKSCLTPSTRPRIIFVDGLCNACINWEEKKYIKWEDRKKSLIDICNKFRSKDQSFDVIVPGGGGKDSDYVAWMLKNEFNMHPLCVCAEPPLESDLGKKNLENFSNSGFNVIKIKPNGSITKNIAKNAFIKYGNPQLDWLFAIHSIPIRISQKLNIPFIMWGEEAESEYGGSNDFKNKTGFNLNQIKKYYRSGIELEELISIEHNQSDLYWLTLPSDGEFKNYNFFAAHWSYFELWNEYKHLELAKEKCGLITADLNPSGAYNNFSHLDQKMYFLHMHLAYLKFGFGRATTDASIDIRYGKLTRDQGIELVRKYDHIFPQEYLIDYLDYFEMDEKFFFECLENHRNLSIFNKINGKWVLE